MHARTNNTVEPLYTDTIGTKILSNSGAPGIFPVGVVWVIGLLSTTWLRFQSFPLLCAGK